MRGVLAALALTLLPMAAAAGTITVKNCSAASIAVNAFKGQERESSSAEARAIPGGTASLYCPAAACRLEVTYYTPSAQIVDFLQPYNGDRCTNGIQDAAIPELPAAGNCGC